MGFLIAFGALIPAIALVIAVLTLKVTQESLDITKEALDQARINWAQGKWFDLYFKADQAYNALDRFQAIYQGSNPAIASVQKVQDQNELMRIFREAHTLAVVFPKSEAIDALFTSTDFKNPNDVLLKERLNSLFAALELLRQKALVNKNVLVVD